MNASQVMTEAQRYELRRSQAYSAGYAEAASAKPSRGELFARLGMHPYVDAYYSGRYDGREQMPLSSSEGSAKR
jgi:hypothetical protein